MTDNHIELRVRLVETALSASEAKRFAREDGRPEDAEYWNRQYRQALVGLNSFRGGDA